MVKFSIGISLIILSLFIGGNQYFENENKIQNAENKLERTQQKIKEMSQFSQRLTKAKSLAMKRGNDQRARLESNLGLNEIGLELKFSSSPRPDSREAQFFYRHEFTISGQSSFFDAFKLVNTLEQKPGFILNYVCVRCENINVETPEDGKEPLRIRGFLNVYNPEQV